MNTPLYIDLYCERTGPEFWNEPFNALSNLAFLIVAVMSWQTSKRRQSGDIWERLIIVLAGSIGIGSFLFHTYARGWAELADVIPIWSFVAAYVLLSIYRSTNHNLIRTLYIALITAAITITIGWFTASDMSSETHRDPAPFNGSLQYIPALITLFFFSGLMHWRQHPARRHLAVATLMFCIALVFRTSDLWACTSTYSIGTHFLWHFFAALMIGVLLHAMIEKMPPTTNTNTNTNTEIKS